MTDHRDTKLNMNFFQYQNKIWNFVLILDKRKKKSLIASDDTDVVLERKISEDGDDVRTLSVEMNTTKRRFLSWRSNDNYLSS